MSKNDRKLTPKQQQFVQRYLVDFNATKAYKESYPNCKSDNTARTNGAKLLAKANIQEAVSKAQKKVAKRNEVDQDWIVQRLKWQADARMSKVAECMGRGELALKDEMTEEEMDALSSYSISETNGAESNSKSIRFQVKDPTKSLELLGKHIGMWKDKDDGGTGKEASSSIKARLAEILEEIGPEE